MPHRPHAALVLLGAAFALGLPAAAQEPAPAACLGEVEASPQLVADALDSGGLIFAPASAGRPALAVGYLSYLRPSLDELPEEAEPVHGAVALVATPAGLRASVPAQSESAVGVFAALDGPDLVIVTQLQIEGPGQSFTVMTTRDGLTPDACAVIDFPPGVNAPSWALESLYLEDVEIAADGRGRLIASAELDYETDAPVMVWWRYDTEDGGRTWSPARPLPGRPLHRGVGRLLALSAAPDAAFMAMLETAARR
jgi:hypothetical protein